jgi:hypothetical protein
MTIVPHMRYTCARWLRRDLAVGGAQSDRDRGETAAVAWQGPRRRDERVRSDPTRDRTDGDGSQTPQRTPT